jgi:Fe-S-cluster-containing hydrogenase component 2
MKDTIEGVTGVVTVERLRQTPGFPAAERLAHGPVACIECVEDIPCNPCEKACPVGAIRVGRPITNLPALDGDRCTGCGQCLAVCPGLAIWLVDMTFSETEAAVSMPFEYLPLPREGETVDGLNRAGEAVCEARVLKARKTRRADGTAILTVVVPKAVALEVRSARRRADTASERGT